MPFKISSIKGVPVWDTIQVAKITNYPFEKEAFKPFAQVRACLSEDGLHLRMWAFETKKRPESYMLAVFNLCENPKRALCIFVYADSKAQICAAKDDTADKDSLTDIKTGFDVDFFEGEDLEGIYWGACVTIKKELIAEHFGGLELKAGDSFKGNLFKACSSPDFAHEGCFSYEGEADSRIFSENRFDTFTIVKY